MHLMNSPRFIEKITKKAAKTMTEKQSADILLKAKILVIDDEKVIRNGCNEVLTQDGYDVILAENGELGLEMIEKSHFDVILLDLMMPGLSGFDVLSRVKALHPDTSIIVITGYATIENSIEAMKKGAFDFIPKPFSPDQLRVVVGKAIEHTGALKDIANEKSRMRVLINLITSGVMVTDAEKKLVLANPAFMKIVGFKGDDIIGRPYTELVQQIQLRQMVERALSVSESEITEITEELKIKKNRDDKTDTFVVRCRPFKDRIGSTSLKNPSFPKSGSSIPSKPLIALNMCSNTLADIPIGWPYPITESSR